ncbi:FxLYD domain-containing protein [Streptomyces sp. NRRL S-350]|uniref:FxLYD domain-containing protein n=1 Tax=Streptomyces sp. NRRL S-350 TaxID=1463902 RepID=UPI00068B44BA|nr:FxLYD domain-containing protein [Streptomyces sp. NRRL S-350]
MNRQPLTRATPWTPPPVTARVTTRVTARVTAQDPDAPPVRRRRRWVPGVSAAAVIGVAALAGCSSGTSASSVASEAASAVQKGASAAASAASALASGAAGAGAAIASAEAQASAAVSAASSAVAGIKGGLDAKGDVTAGAVSTGSDGKAQVQLTVTNHGQQSYRYVIQVDFTDESGKVLDATAVTVQDVAAGQSAQATAHGNRDLSGTVKAQVANAVRY